MTECGKGTQSGKILELNGGVFRESLVETVPLDRLLTVAFQAVSLVSHKESYCP